MLIFVHGKTPVVNTEMCYLSYFNYIILGRFGELEKLMPDTSRKVLIQQLRDLEADGIVRRRIFAEIPPKVEYSLTENGESLTRIFHLLRLWGNRMINNKRNDAETQWV
jgi:DNA-binding HxlR family transcriptional regulator